MADNNKTDINEMNIASVDQSFAESIIERYLHFENIDNELALMYLLDAQEEETDVPREQIIHYYTIYKNTLLKLDLSYVNKLFQNNKTAEILLQRNNISLNQLYSKNNISNQTSEGRPFYQAASNYLSKKDQSVYQSENSTTNKYFSELRDQYKTNLNYYREDNNHDVNQIQQSVTLNKNINAYNINNQILNNNNINNNSINNSNINNSNLNTSNTNTSNTNTNNTNISNTSTNNTDTSSISNENTGSNNISIEDKEKQSTKKQKGKKRSKKGQYSDTNNIKTENRQIDTLNTAFNLKERPRTDADLAESTVKKLLSINQAILNQGIYKQIAKSSSLGSSVSTGPLGIQEQTQINLSQQVINKTVRNNRAVLNKEIYSQTYSNQENALNSYENNGSIINNYQADLKYQDDYSINHYHAVDHQALSGEYSGYDIEKYTASKAETIVSSSEFISNRSKNIDVSLSQNIISKFTSNDKVLQNQEDYLENYYIHLYSENNVFRGNYDSTMLSAEDSRPYIKAVKQSTIDLAHSVINNLFNFNNLLTKRGVDNASGRENETAAHLAEATRESYGTKESYIYNKYLNQYLRDKNFAGSEYINSTNINYINNSSADINYLSNNYSNNNYSNNNYSNDNYSDNNYISNSYTDKSYGKNNYINKNYINSNYPNRNNSYTSSDNIYANINNINKKSSIVDTTINRFNTSLNIFSANLNSIKAYNQYANSRFINNSKTALVQFDFSDGRVGNSLNDINNNLVYNNHVDISRNDYYNVSQNDKYHYEINKIYLSRLNEMADIIKAPVQAGKQTYVKNNNTIKNDLVINSNTLSQSIYKNLNVQKEFLLKRLNNNVVTSDGSSINNLFSNEAKVNSLYKKDLVSNTNHINSIGDSVINHSNSFDSSRVNYNNADTTNNTVSLNINNDMRETNISQKNVNEYSAEMVNLIGRNSYIDFAESIQKNNKLEQKQTEYILSKDKKLLYETESQEESSSTEMLHKPKEKEEKVPVSEDIQDITVKTVKQNDISIEPQIEEAISKQVAKQLMGQGKNQAVTDMTVHQLVDKVYSEITKKLRREQLMRGL